ncbi:MAG: acetyltransferase [Vicinamibacteria bacterium]
MAIGDNWRRRETTLRAEALVPGIAFAAVVHARATVAPDVELGPGSVVLPGAVIVSGTRLGRGCIVNTLASLDHEGLLDDFASLAPGVVAGGRVQVGEGSAIGLGARLVHRVRVGRHSVVGAGSLVLDDVPDGVVAYGSPARVVRPRAPDEPYL